MSFARRRGWGRFALLLLLPLAVAAQLPPIAIWLDPAAGWEEAPTGDGAAAVLKKRDAGRVIGAITVVISESKDQKQAAITDPGVAAGLERELLSAVPGAVARPRESRTVAGFAAVVVTADVTLDGKPRIVRQITVDVRRGAVTITALVEAARADSLLAEVDSMISAMKIDA